jgi:hypothetical protein
VGGINPPTRKQNKKAIMNKSFSKSNPTTIVNYWNGHGASAVKRQAVFAGNFSDDEATRQVLLQKQTPKHRIESISHKN